MPSALRQGLLCRTTTAGITFFRSSGLPFFTVAITMSPTPAAGSRFRRAPIPFTEMMYRLRAPELSQQFMTAPLYERNRQPKFCSKFFVWICWRNAWNTTRVWNMFVAHERKDSSSDIHRQTECHLELVAGGTATPKPKALALLLSRE